MDKRINLKLENQFKTYLKCQGLTLSSEKDLKNAFYAGAATVLANFAIVLDAVQEQINPHVEDIERQESENDKFDY